MENKSLPIANFRLQIIETISKNAVTIITAETGAGKSTQVPQFLLAEGYDLVVTQPRRLAARTVSERVAEEFGCEFGKTVGFRTAYERADSEGTRCLFVTDGLALVRELMGAGRHQVLVLDEVHEWNLNLEVLVAWTRKRLAEGANFKVVLMSATLEAEKLSEFFGGAPIISVPGRLFPVTEEKPQGCEMIRDVERLLRVGRNVLCFQPGKKEIGEMVMNLENLRNCGLNAEILALHGELDTTEQRKCFAHYGRPKVVVSTNVAQTSVTIDDIDAVVDSGMERRVEVVGGVEGLYLKPISRADSSQRKGRAGRCKPGVYIDWCESADRLEFPKAEILRSRLDQTVLRLAEAGFDMEELRFFHQPELAEIHEAKRALCALGCLDENGKVTRIGHHVAKLPVSVQFGRMLVEANRLGVVDDILTVAAILEQGEITMRPRDKYDDPPWKKLCEGEFESDIMAQLMVWKKAEKMSKDQLRENGVFAKAFYQAKERRFHLVNALRDKVRDLNSTGKREDILRAVCAGMVDHLYQNRFGSWMNGDCQERQLARESVISRWGTSWLIGLPFDLEIKARYGKQTLRLVRMATKVDPNWLMEVAPQLVKAENGINPVYDEFHDTCMSMSRVTFNGQVIKEESVPTPTHDMAPLKLAEWLAGQMVAR